MVLAGSVSVNSSLLSCQSLFTKTTQKSTFKHYYAVCNYEFYKDNCKSCKTL